MIVQNISPGLRAQSIVFAEKANAEINTHWNCLLACCRTARLRCQSLARPPHQSAPSRQWSGLEPTAAPHHHEQFSISSDIFWIENNNGRGDAHVWTRKMSPGRSSWWSGHSLSKKILQEAGAGVGETRTSSLRGFGLCCSTSLWLLNR
jgi:hypothetical protein